jgi:hypothetical protein
MVFCKSCKYFKEFYCEHGASFDCISPKNMYEKHNFMYTWSVFKQAPCDKNLKNNCPDFKPKLWQRFLNLFRKNKM